MHETLNQTIRLTCSLRRLVPEASGWVYSGAGFLLAVFLAGCSNLAAQGTPEKAFHSTPSLPASQTSLPAPTRTPVPAPEYESGVIEFPAGFVLLLSNYTWQICTRECDCPAVEGLPRAYDIREGRLYLYRSGMDQSWGDGLLPDIVFVYGDFEQALSAVRELPFVEQGDFPILAALKDGTIVYEWAGHPYQLAMGEAWQITRSADYGGGCVITDTSSLRNLGLWQEGQVEIEN